MRSLILTGSGVQLSPVALGIPAYLFGMTAAIYARFGGWAYDDPFIIYRYAQNLAKGAGLVYNPGLPVLSTTTISFPLILAGLLRLFPWLDLPQIANLIGAFCLACGGLLVWDLSRTWGPSWAGWAGLLLYPTFPHLLTTLGSEMPLYLAAALAALVMYARGRYLFAAGFAALATLTRPDGVLLALALSFHYILRVRRPFPWNAAAVYAGLIVPWLLFAWNYYGSPIPTTLTAKQFQGAMSISLRFLPGLVYTLQSSLGQPFLAVQTGLVFIGTAALFQRYRSWGLVWGWLLAFVISYSLLGVSRYFWYYAPLVAGWVPTIGLGIAALENAISSRIKKPDRILGVVPVGTAAATLLLVVVFILQGTAALELTLDADLRYAVFRRAGDWLRLNTAANAQVGALEIGVIGYYAERPIVDFAGLIQPQVSRLLPGQNSYEAAARYAVEFYKPNYVVLLAGFFPLLERDLMDQGCLVVWEIPGDPQAYPSTIQIHGCPNGD